MESVCNKLVNLHGELRVKFPHLSRMAIAIYDKDNDLLKTFIDSTVGHDPINHYSIELASVPSLKELADTKSYRIIEDLNILGSSKSKHSQWLSEQGFRSSYTVPLFSSNQLIGFLFFDADKPQYFDQFIIKSLNVYAELISTVLINELAPLYTLRGALSTAQHLTHHRDTETALHITRMSHYSYLLAQKLSGKLGLSDEYIEYVLQYSPLHDIGKIGIPDSILLKPGKLTADEFSVIKTHVQIGVDIIDAIIKEFNLEGFSHLSILTNVIGCHHERYDGSGYPHGLKGTDIPLEGRIVAVADVLDALSHPRPYKAAFSFDDSVNYIEVNSGKLFDPECYAILDNSRKDFRAVFEKFKD